MSADEKFMQRCLDLAAPGAGHVAPNPMVGSVMVYDGLIVGEGYHRKYGKAHAEVNCVQDARERYLANNSDESGFALFASRCTIYVSLEPCAHFGKTPPCADLIISLNFKKVVVGCRDPFPLVDGKGIEKIRSAGIEVITGVLEKECQEINKRFFTFHLQKRPYVILKWAKSADGFIAGKSDRRSFISNDLSNRLVHRWRSEEAAILVGTNTAEKDDPSLNTRLWAGNSPKRLVIDRRLRLPRTLKLFTDGEPTTIFNELKSGIEGSRHFVSVTADRPLVEQILSLAHELNIQSIIVEGGTETLRHFIDTGQWDEARVIQGDKVVLEDGIREPLLSGAISAGAEKLGSDTINYFRNKSVL